ncbi:FG-GAP-like repeat-containing protein [Bradyrhizobium zhanjiangense]|uniref:Uncharacterized protein n=1 Tax=Bradyrhizobium zhanjiangense TaxID=1325107 RepID=A0A4Q0Q7S6_9BRAD|nr:FG-GAP-like repeat-containing protein [Bradyrhizobium zhanjiangense]RXG84820.1 hypothetical protein EAS61_37795 [Bradyrhizobium zhanjiangense]
MRAFRAGLTLGFLMLSLLPESGSAQSLNGSPKTKTSASVGTVDGTFDVSLLGAATYTIPIKIPPGTAGTQPKLSLVYSSQAPATSMGLGWAIAGLSKINRGPKNWRTDGEVRGIEFKATDALFLDGQRLIPTGKTGTWKGKTTAEFVKEIDDQTRVSAISEAPDDLSGFIVETKAGLTLMFGLSENAQNRLYDKGPILSWMCSRITDSAGNYITFNYLNSVGGDYEIGSIAYTGNEHSGQTPYATVEFAYTKILYPALSFMAGRPISKTRRLTAVTSRVGTAQGLRYVFEYGSSEGGPEAPESNNAVLKSITQFADNGRDYLNSTRFEYSKPTDGSIWLPDGGGYGDPGAIVPSVGENVSGGYRVVKMKVPVSAPPRNQIIYGADLRGVQERGAFENKSDHFEPNGNLTTPSAFISDGMPTGAIVLDLDGTDLPYLVSPNPGQPYAAILHWDGGKWTAPTGQYPIPMSSDGLHVVSILAGNITSGGPLADVIWSDPANPARGGALVNKGPNAGGLDPVNQIPPLPLDQTAQLLDANCDGVKELTYFGNGRNEAYAFDPRLRQWIRVSQYDLPTGAAASSPAAIKQVRTIPSSGQSCALLIISDARHYSGALVADPVNGWQIDLGHDPSVAVDSFSFVDIAGVDQDARIVDFGGQPGIVSTSFARSYIVTDTTILTLAKARLPRPANSNSITYVGDLNNDGYPDVVYFSNSRYLPNEAFLYFPSDQEWRPAQRDFLPGVSFTRAAGQDEGVRLVDLYGNGLLSIISSREANGTTTNQVIKENTGHGWQTRSWRNDKTNPPIPDVPVPMSADYNLNNAIQFVDVDRDGFIDLVFSIKTKSGAKISKVYKNSIEASDGHHYWDDVASVQLPTDNDVIFGDATAGDRGVRFVDLDGDGVADIIYSRLEKDRTVQGAYLHKLETGEWKPSKEYAPPPQVPFVIMPGAAGNTQSYSKGTNVQLIDVNGDGLPDLVYNFTTPDRADGTVTKGVCLNGGHGWLACEEKKAPPVKLDQVNTDFNTSIAYTDLNGDGLIDIVVTNKTNASLTKTFLGNGSDWTEMPSWKIPSQLISARPGDPGFRLVDINGDGLPDLVFRVDSGDRTAINLGYASGPLESAAWKVLPSGNQYMLPRALSTPDGGDNGVRLLDVDGNGLVDLVLSKDGEAGVWTNRNRRAGVLNSIVDGLGVTTTLCYRTLLEVDNLCNGSSVQPVYQAGGSKNQDAVIRGTPAMYVVASVLVDDGANKLNFAYRYEQLRFDALARKSFGFHAREVLDLNKNLLSRTELAQEPYLDSLPVLETRVLKGATVERTETGWTPDKRTISSSAGTYIVAQVKKTKIANRTWDIDGSLFGDKADEFEFDQYLNVKKSTTIRSDGTSVSIANEYFSDPRWAWLGRLKTSTVTKVGDQVGGVRQSETAIATFDYNPGTLLLSDETSNIGAKAVDGTKLQVHAHYDRDVFGNVKKIILEAAREPTRVTERVFSKDGRVLEKETDPAGHVITRTYSSIFGGETSVVDANGLKTTTTYDGFGRRDTTTDINGVVTKYTYDVVTGASSYSRPNAKFSVTATVAKLPPVISVLDGRGRLVRKVTSGTKSQGKRIFQDTDYDEYGRVVRQTLPYFEGESTPPTLTRAYDALDRTILLTQPNRMAYARTTYQGRKTVVETTLDTRIARTTTITNVRNLPIVVCGPNFSGACDAKATSPGTLAYEYDAGDRLSKIVSTVVDDLGNPRKAITAHTYDSVGHRSGTSDPDLGHWTYRYDAFGQLREQTDAQNQTTQLEYDSLGRIKHRVAPDREDVWTYDTAPGGVGRVATITTKANGRDLHREEMSYAKGRLATKTVRIDKREALPNPESFVTSYQYDGYGRIAQIHYPDGFVVQNTFDENGYLVSVGEPNSANPWWSASEIDPVGRVLNERFGNGAVTERHFDPLSGYLKTLKTDAGNAAIQDISFGYDLAGDVTSKTRVGHTETFGYDLSQQLISVTLDGIKTEQLTYDVLGSVLEKQVKGKKFTFDYDHYKPPFHAPKAISDLGGASKVYTYSEGITHHNGNRLSEQVINADGTEGLLTQFQYSIDNRVTKISHPREAVDDNWSTFEYTASGQRYRQTQVKPDRNSFVGVYSEVLSIDLYERSKSYRIGKPEVLHRHYIGNLGGIFAVVDKSESLAEVELNVPKDLQQRAAGLKKAPSETLARKPKISQRAIYIHKDALGSVTELTDERGQLVGSFDFDPWGLRRDKAPDDFTAQNWERGYAGHTEVLKDQDAYGRYVHMNGRVYDPAIGAFVSPDLVTQVLTDERTFNRYAYALNNPLKYVDPTGYWSIGSVWHDITQGAGDLYHGVVQAGHDLLAQAGQWIGQNWREVVIIAAAVGVTVLTAGASSPILAGLLSGAAAGGLSSALYGGSINDVLSAALRGAVLGGLAGGIAEVVSAGSWQSVLAHGGLGGLENLARGEDFAKGFELAALSSLEPDVARISGFSGATLLQIGAAAALSGTIAAVEGGKFANGAAWGAFAQIQIDSSSYKWSIDIQSTTLRSVVDTAQTIVRDVTTFVAAVNSLPVTLRGIVAADVVAVTTQVAGVRSDFRSSLAFVRDQMSNDPFTLALLLFPPPQGVGWTDSGQYGFQGVGSAYFGAYWYQSASTYNYNVWGQIGFDSQSTGWPSR